MEIEINWLAILLATVVGNVLGMFWYSKLGFGEIWMKLTGINPDKEEMKEGPGWIMAVPIVTIFLVAVGVAHVAYVTYEFFDTTFLATSLQTALWVWLTFSFTTLLVHSVFEGKGVKLTLLNGAYGLALFISIGLVIGLMGV